MLKNGCKVEALQLSSIERLELALALFMIIAWRVQMLMRLGRTCPDMDCEVMFERDEWQAAYIVARKPIPKQPPSLNTVVRLIASFGAGTDHIDLAAAAARRIFVTNTPGVFTDGRQPGWYVAEVVQRGEPC